ncbi:MAG: ferritin-like domain-containing protein [Chloroflexi bacterium]|nr:ferritin-like domain-containing protein [Chloroflexota bacterium]
MESDAFVAELVGMVDAFCQTLDAAPPAYSYVPLSSDDDRVLIMKSRLFNEQRAADIYGGWLKTTPEFEVKAHMAESAYEEMEHAEILAGRIRDMGHDPFEYQPLPAQMAMFNALEGLPDTCQRIAGFSLAGESVAMHLIRKSLDAPSVPDWIKAPYKRIAEDEEGHGSAPKEFLARYAVTPEIQDSARRAVAMRLVLFQEYLSSLDRWVLDKQPW